MSQGSVFQGRRRICCLSHSGVVSDGKGEGGGVLGGVAVRLVRVGNGLVEEEGGWSAWGGSESEGVLRGEVSFAGVAS